MKKTPITATLFYPCPKYSSHGLSPSFSLINEVVSINSSRFHPANSEVSLCACTCWGGSARVQTSIHPEGNGFTPQSSQELTHFCYLCLLHSMAGLSLSMGHLCVRACVCVCMWASERACVCAIPPVWLTSLAVAVRQIERHLLLVKAVRTPGSSAHFLRWICSYMRR